MQTRKVLTAFAICSFVFAIPSLSLADEYNRKIVFTFSQPVSIPAVHQPNWGVLPAGTYVFKIADSSSNRHIVQIFNEAETKIYATILAIPSERVHVTGDVVITFRETPAGQPVAIRAMFYPGRSFGEEFVYPKAQATQLAQVTSTPVLSMPVAQENPTPEAPQVVAELEQTPVTAIEPTGVEVQTAEIITPPAPEELKVTESAEKLPATASALPFITLVGFLLVGIAYALRFAAKRTQ